MFVNWWNSLTGLQQFLACGALPATALLLLQTILLLFGLGGGHDADQGEVADHSLELGDGTADTEASDLDAPDPQTPDSEFIPSDEPEMPHHDGAHHADGVRIFTVRGIIAFVAVGGWAGIAMVDLGLPNVWASVIAVFSGTLALLRGMDSQMVAFPAGKMGRWIQKRDCTCRNGLPDRSAQTHRNRKSQSDVPGTLCRDECRYRLRPSAQAGYTDSGCRHIRRDDADRPSAEQPF